MGIIGRVTQGTVGNLSEIAPEELKSEFGEFLMKDETIKTGFKLIRDVVIFTDKRIIDIDKQGATGQKARITSIYLDSIINVTVETSGFGIDDSEIGIDYISSPYYRSNGGVTVSQRKFEFPKKYNVAELYIWLSEAAYANHLHINK